MLYNIFKYFNTSLTFLTISYFPISLQSSGKSIICLKIRVPVLQSGSSLLLMLSLFPGPLSFGLDDVLEADGGVVALRRVEELPLGRPPHQLLPVHHLLRLKLLQQAAVLVSAP